MPQDKPHFWSYTLPVLASAVVVLGLLFSGAHAHEGHDSGPAVTMAVGPGTIVRTASSDRFELVCKYQQPAPGESIAVLFLLSDRETNAPVQGATLLLEGRADSESVSGTATAVSPGIYRAMLTFPAKGSYLMRVTIQGAGKPANLALSDLDVGFHAGSPAALSKPGGLPALGLALALIGVLALAGLVLGVRRRSGRPAALALVAALCGAGAFPALLPHDSLAHEGHDQAPAAASSSGLRYVSKESQFLLGILTASAATRVLHAQVDASGHVVPESGATARIASPQTGQLQEAGSIPAVGSHVGKGQILSYVMVIDRLPIRSPIDGTISEIKFTPGQWVQAGQELAVVVDNRRVRVEAQLFGEDLIKALRAQSAVVTSEALPGMTFAAKVLGVAPLLEETGSGHAVPFLLSVANQGRLLRPGMLVQVSLLLPASAPAILVARSAIVRTESGPVVFVHAGPELFELRPVQVGDTRGEDVAILQGVRPGERLVVSGAYSILAAPNAPVASAK